MGSIMASATGLILVVKSFTMRQPVAVLTGHQLAMFRMALGAGQGRMFGFLCRQLLVRIGMATGADLFILVKRIRYLPRRMHRVAGQTVSGSHLYCRTV